MAEQENMATLRRFYEEVINQGRVALVDELFTPSFVSHHNDPAGLPPGPEGIKAFVLGTRGGFPDLRISTEDIFAEGDRVASRWTMSGNNTGVWFGNPPTGRPASWAGVVITRFEQGKIAEEWYNFDQMSLLMQLGIIQSPA